MDEQEFKLALDDILQQRWQFSSESGRRHAISMVERLMNGEILEMIEAEPAPIRKAKDEVDDVLAMDSDEAIKHLLALIYKAMVAERVTPSNRKSFYISGE